MVSTRFQKAVDTIKKLEMHKRYLGAFLFGSVARNETTNKSDLDIWVIVDKDNSCTNINHPFIDGIKLDISFISLKQLQLKCKEELEQRIRIPMIAESIIIFDKNGDLSQIKESMLRIEPLTYEDKDYQRIQFLLYHANDKVQRNIVENPDTALLAMHMGLTEVLKVHYRLHKKWWLSDKRLLLDLKTWDESLTFILIRFLHEANFKKKFEYWTELIDYILKPIGGRQKIEDNNCNCEVCTKDLETLALS